MTLNFSIIGRIIGILLMFNGVFMILCLPISLFFKEGDTNAILLSSGITSVFGSILWVINRGSSNDFKKREGYLIVVLGWLSMSFFGTLPYILSGAIDNFSDAFFETISGFSTTGATILTDIEGVHKGILFWRSLTQWIGGMGIIVLAVAILPILGIGGMQLFVAEAPGISPDKLQPRIKETAKRLWYIYLGLTATECLLLLMGGMNFYDAINHSLTTMATGGFSTKNDSIAHFTSPFIQYVITIFMFAAGTNFTITYFALHFDFKKVFKNEEFRNYLIFTGFYTVAVGLAIFVVSDSLTLSSFEQSFRDALFQVVSIITTTGYITADYTQWSPFVTTIFFMLMFFGASAGSTAGGVKIVRHLILIKNSFLELKRQVHPNAVIPLRFNGRAVSQDIVFNILAFIMIYITIFAAGSVLLAITGTDLMTSIGAVATCLGNIGPGLGTVGPVDNFAHISVFGKWLLSFLMLLGRLELFTVLMILTPYFWRKH